MTDSDSPRQQLREAIKSILSDPRILWASDAADAIVAFLSEAGWGPTAAHEACIKRLRERWVQVNLLDPEEWVWVRTEGGREVEPMTEAEQEVMSHAGG